jgi:hypothetical protein
MHLYRGATIGDEAGPEQGAVAPVLKRYPAHNA